MLEAFKKENNIVQRAGGNTQVEHVFAVALAALRHAAFAQRRDFHQIAFRIGRVQRDAVFVQILGGIARQTIDFLTEPVVDFCFRPGT